MNKQKENVTKSYPKICKREEWVCEFDDALNPSVIPLFNVHHQLPAHVMFLTCYSFPFGLYFSIIKREVHYFTISVFCLHLLLDLMKFVRLAQDTRVLFWLLFRNISEIKCDICKWRQENVYNPNNIAIKAKDIRVRENCSESIREWIVKIKGNRVADVVSPKEKSAQTHTPEPYPCFFGWVWSVDVNLS